MQIQTRLHLTDKVRTTAMLIFLCLGITSLQMCVCGGFCDMMNMSCFMKIPLSRSYYMNRQIHSHKYTITLFFIREVIINIDNRSTLTLISVVSEFTSNNPYPADCLGMNLDPHKM
jgi:hypothetical protein